MACCCAATSIRRRALSVMVLVGALPQMLINGVVTSQQVVPSNKPGESTVVVTGEDISLNARPGREERDVFPTSPTPSSPCGCWGSYASLGLLPYRDGRTTDVPLILERLPNQQGNRPDLPARELARRQRLHLLHRGDGARRHPTGLLGTGQPPGAAAAGPDHEHGSVHQRRFVHQLLVQTRWGPVAPTVTIFEPFTGLAFDISRRPTCRGRPLARQPAPALRKTKPRR